jgi:DNA polymerase III delta prime subunit
MIKFLPVPEKEIREKLKSLIKKRTDFEKIVKLAAGRSGRAIRLLQEKDFLTEQEKNLEEFEKILKADLIWRFEKAREISQNTVLAQEILSQWLLWLRDRILESNGCPELMTSGQERKSWVSKYPLLKMLDACREIQKTQAILSNPSFNARLALEILMMKI